MFHVKQLLVRKFESKKVRKIAFLLISCLKTIKKYLKKPNKPLK
jgi:hypothetical protein